MQNWVSCNVCFHPPTANHRLALTACGHIICQKCYQKGKPGECLFCKAQCHVSLLSDKSRPEVTALFSDVSVVANKYLSEINKVLIFQMRHQKRLLAHFRQKSQKLEEVMSKMKQEMLMMNKKITELKAHIAKRDASLQSLKAAQQHNRFDPPSHAAMPNAVQLRLNSRTSQISHSARSATVSRDKPYRHSDYLPNSSTIPSPNLSYRRESGWETASINPPQSARYLSLSSLTLPPFNLQGGIPK
ncbi:hypothetical protein GJAV_G00166880 [Gymnothorax javanicus]|nr:hypothetical protein GJAV_G00166880 [Gymnothorax javanicus]